MLKVPAALKLQRKASNARAIVGATEIRSRKDGSASKWAELKRKKPIGGGESESLENAAAVKKRKKPICNTGMSCSSSCHVKIGPYMAVVPGRYFRSKNTKPVSIGKLQVLPYRKDVERLRKGKKKCHRCRRSGLCWFMRDERESIEAENEALNE